MQHIIGILLDHGVDVDAKDKWERTPITLAAKYEHEAVVRLLISRDAAVRLDAFHRTPLYYAAMRGKKAMVKMLLDKYPENIDLKNDLMELLVSLDAYVSVQT